MARMKVLITGGDGLLGSEVRRALDASCDLLHPNRAGMDVTQVDRVFDIVSKFRPDVVVHCAASTDLDDCEQNPARAFHVNAMGAQNVALACLQFNAAMMYVSCDSIFDGASDTPYWEYDYSNPPSIYGKSKLAGERSVIQHLSRFWIVRTGWLFGRSRKNFVVDVLKAARARRPIRAIADQVGTPTYAPDLAGAIQQLIKSPFYGIYHVTNAGMATWEQFAQDILQAAGVEAQVVPISLRDLDGRAPRSQYTVLNNSIFLLRGFQPLRDYREALAAYLNDAQGAASR